MTTPRRRVGLWTLPRPLLEQFTDYSTMHNWRLQATVRVANKLKSEGMLPSWEDARVATQAEIDAICWKALDWSFG